MMRALVRTRLTGLIVLALGALLFARLRNAGEEAAPRARARVAPIVPAAPLDPLFEDIEKRTFNFFWETTEGATGLVPDRWPGAPFASIAAVGFALNAYAIGVERGYVTRAQARARVLTTLRFLHAAPQGARSRRTARATRAFSTTSSISAAASATEIPSCPPSTPRCSWRACCSWAATSTRTNADEAEIRKLADELYRRVNWPWSIEHVPDIRMAWSPEGQFQTHDWRGYNEAMLVYILALGSPTFPAARQTWLAWTSDYYRSWGTLEGQTHLTFGPMFGHQFSAMWIDFRGIKDEFMWPLGIDYFENSRRGVLSQRAYAIRNPLDWRGYGPNIWGITASDGPGDFKLPYLGQTRAVPRLLGAWRGPGRTARGNLRRRHHRARPRPSRRCRSREEIVVPATREMHKRYGQYIYGKYGFVDAFNPSFDYDVPLKRGRRVRGVGWVASDYLGIDQGAIISMIENHRSELIWTVMKRNPYIQRGLDARGLRRRLAQPSLEREFRHAARRPNRACRRSSCARR